MNLGNMRSGIPAIAIAGVLLLGSAASGASAALLITGKQIKDNTVTSADIKNGTLKTKDMSSKTLVSLKGATGATGPAGPAGPAGLTGLTGPAGASANASQAIVQGPTVTVGAGQIGFADAYCPAGKKVTGGGYFASIAIPASSGPAAPSPTTGWRTVINNSQNSISVDVYAFAICA